MRRMISRSLWSILLIALQLSIMAPHVSAAVDQIAWRQFSGSSADGIGAACSAADKNGNLVVAGFYQKRLFVTKYRPGGRIAWTKRFAIEGVMADVSDVAVDRNGNIYVVGSTYTDDSGTVAFVRKYGPKGGHHWTRMFGPQENWTMATGVAVGPAGNIYVVGDTDGKLVESASLAMQSVFIRKYNSAGKVFWTRQFTLDGAGSNDPWGSENEAYALDVAVGPGGGVYLLGEEIDWDYYLDEDIYPEYPEEMYPDFPESSENWSDEEWMVWLGQYGLGEYGQQREAEYLAWDEENYAADDDMYWEDEVPEVNFVRKFSPRGGVYWTRRFGSDRHLSARALATDRMGQTVVVGDSPKGSFATKFTHKGRRSWTKFWYDGGANDVVVDRDRNIYIVGQKGEYPGTWTAGDPVYAKAYSRKLSPSGKDRWTRYFANGRALAAATDNDRNLFIIGDAVVPQKDIIVKFRQ